jgi:hypothetical protein
VTGEFLHPAFLGYSGKNKFLHIYLMHKILNLTSNNNTTDNFHRQHGGCTLYPNTTNATTANHNTQRNRTENFAAPTLHFAKTISIIITK